MIEDPIVAARVRQVNRELENLTNICSKQQREIDDLQRQVRDLENRVHDNERETAFFTAKIA